jgi:RNA polymerase sigma-70 factor (ECF subfamily)
MSERVPSDAGALFYPYAARACTGGQNVKLEELVAEQFAKLRKPVYEYLTATFCSPADAEEITQEAFLQMYRTLHDGQTIRHMRSWVLRLAPKLAVERGKQRGKIPVLNAPAAELAELIQARRDPALDPEQQVLQQERRWRLRSAWVELTPQQRQCLRLRVEGLRYREIADVLGVSVSTVQDSLERSIAKLMRETNG